VSGLPEAREAVVPGRLLAADPAGPPASGILPVPSLAEAAG
jgi:hypothetical protein